jgi:glutaredoxin-like protein
MADPIIIYGADWCFDCRRARRFFDQQQVIYKWVDIDRDKTGEQYVLMVNKGMRSIPTIVFPDGSFLVEPSNNQLAKKLKIPETHLFSW